MISFCLYLKPTSLQGALRAGNWNGKSWVYSNAKKKQWHRAVTAAAAQFKPDKPLAEPTGIAIAFTFLMPKESSAYYPTRQMDGDFDNLSKSFIDCLVKAGHLENDKWIVDAWISKRFGDRDKVEVVLGPVDLWCSSHGISK